MVLSADLMKKVADAVSANQPATKDDLLLKYKLEITVHSGYLGYANPRVTATIDALSSAEVSFVKLLPLRDEGLVILLPATPEEPGAVEFTRGDSRRTGALNLRTALSAFDLELTNNRNLKVPVTPETIHGEKGEMPVLLLRIKRPSTVKSVRRPRKKKDDTVTPVATVPVSAPATAPSTAPASAPSTAPASATASAPITAPAASSAPVSARTAETTAGTSTASSSPGGVAEGATTAATAPEVNQRSEAPTD